MNLKAKSMIENKERRRDYIQSKLARISLILAHFQSSRTSTVHLNQLATILVCLKKCLLFIVKGQVML